MAAHTVVVSGGAGFIGTRVVRRLLDSGLEIVVLDDLHQQVHPDRVWPVDLDARAVRVRGSVERVEAWSEALERAGDHPTVLHLAAETGTGQSLTEARRHASVNVLGTAALTDALVALRVRPASIVLTSSRAVYGEGAWTGADGRTAAVRPRAVVDLEAGEWNPRIAGTPAVRPVPHDARTTAANPTNVYAATKLAQEHLLASWCSAMDVPLSILRLQNVYGAGQSLTNTYTGVLTFFATRAVAGQAIEVYEGGGIVRDFVHVADVADALVAAVRGPGALDVPVDIGSGSPVTLETVARTMARLAGAPEPTVSTRYRLGDVRAASASISVAQERLGYTPAVPLESGLAELLAFARP